MERKLGVNSTKELVDININKIRDLTEKGKLKRLNSIIESIALDIKARATLGHNNLHIILRDCASIVDDIKDYLTFKDYTVILESDSDNDAESFKMFISW